MSLLMNLLDFIPRNVQDAIIALVLYTTYEWMGYEDFVAGILILIFLAVCWVGGNIGTEARQ